MSVKTKLALIAGRGGLPQMMAESALEQGVSVLALALTSSIKRTLVDLEKKYPENFTLKEVDPVKVTKMLELIKSEGAEQITFIGKVPKMEFFQRLPFMEKKFIKKIQSLPDLHDDTLHSLVTEVVEQDYGLKVADQTKYMRKYFSSEQTFTKRQATDEELEEIDYGLRLAKENGRLDIGQTVVVQKKSVLAVEAIEGTNECIKRAKSLLGFFSKDKHITVCKASKPNQDQRFDVPTLGLGTVRCAGPGSIIAFEANETLFVEQKEAIEYADKNNILIVARAL